MTDPTPLHDGSDTSHATSESLLERAKAREPAAWCRLVDLYGPLVYHWCRHSGLQRQDALDVGQEVFRAVLTAIGDLHRDRPGDRFRGWLWTITRNKLRDYFRKSRRQDHAAGGSENLDRLAEIADPVPLADAPPADSVPSVENRALELVRASVEPQTWAAFWLVVVEDRTPASVAEELGISLQAVYDARYRVRRRIRTQFDGLLEL